MDNFIEIKLMDQLIFNSKIMMPMNAIGNMEKLKDNVTNIISLKINGLYVNIRMVLFLEIFPMDKEYLHIVIFNIFFILFNFI